jgi:hypothetical protein
MKDTPKVPQLVLCVPGPWTSRSDLLERLIADSGDYIFAGGIIMNINTKSACELEFQETPDENMESAFSVSDVSEGKTFSSSIARHRSVVYLVGPGGLRSVAESMMVTAAALVKAGGLGVKVESSGIAHSAVRWLELVSDLPYFSVHEALVVYVKGQRIRSCGMHNLGLPEASIDANACGATAELLKAYTFYLFSESPEIHEGQTFSVEKSAPVFRLSFEAGFDYGPDSLFNNPFGNWHLAPASSETDVSSIGRRLMRGLRSRWLN